MRIAQRDAADDVRPVVWRTEVLDFDPLWIFRPGLPGLAEAWRARVESGYFRIDEHGAPHVDEADRDELAIRHSL